MKHRPIGGAVKTLTVKRDAVGRLWLFFSVIEQVIIPNGVTPGKIAGFDFGLNTFLTDHTGKVYPSGLQSQEGGHTHQPDAHPCGR